MVHSCVRLEPVFERFPHKIQVCLLTLYFYFVIIIISCAELNQRITDSFSFAQCLDTWNQQLVVGTTDGGLLLLAERPQVVIPEFHTIQHVAVCPPLAVTHVATCDCLDVVAVLGSCVTVHALPSLKQLSTINCPNPLALAVGGGSHGPSSCTLAVCCLVGGKHKLHIFLWNTAAGAFELKREVPLAQAASTMVWANGDSLFIGYKTEYVLLQAFATAPTPLFTTGIAGVAAVAAAMPGGSEVILARDDITIFQVPHRLFFSPRHHLTISCRIATGARAASSD